MAYCPNCGHDISDGDKYCPECGEDISNGGQTGKGSSNWKKNTDNKSESGTSQNSSDNSGAASLLVGGIVLAAFIFASTVSVVTAENTYIEEVPVEQNYQEEVDMSYERIDFSVDEDTFSSFSGGLVGSVDASYELRNTDDTGGRFSVTFNCEGEDTQVTLSDSAYVQEGESVTLSASTQDEVQQCNADLDVPTKTVTRTETVMEERQKSETVKLTILEALMR